MGFSMTTWATYLLPPLAVSFAFYPPFEPILPESPDTTDLEAGDLPLPGQSSDREGVKLQNPGYLVGSHDLHEVLLGHG